MSCCKYEIHCTLSANGTNLWAQQEKFENAQKLGINRTLSNIRPKSKQNGSSTLQGSLVGTGTAVTEKLNVKGMRDLNWKKEIRRLENNYLVRIFDEIVNKTGSSQVGAISNAQKYSKNNYWKLLEKLFFSKKFLKIFFRKKVFF